MSVRNTVFFEHYIKADAVLCAGGSLVNVVGNKSPGKMFEIEGGEPDEAVLEITWRLHSGDAFSIYLTMSQAEDAKYLGEGIWRVRGTTDPDLAEPIVETFGIEMVAFAPVLP